MIKITNLSKTYKVKDGDPVLALKDINLTLPEKGLVFIVGKSGSGKSTLLNMIGTLDDSTSGAINVDGNLITEMKSDRLSAYRNNYLGFVFQDFYLINELSVYDNIALASSLNNENDLSKIDKVIEQVGLKKEKHRHPNNLSGGQKQRVAIARSIVKSPKILLCDEPTGNLDSKTSKQIISLLKEISKNILVIIVSHNMEDAYLYGDRLIEIKDGEIVRDLTNTGVNKPYEIKDNTLYLNSVEQLNKDDINAINEEVKQGKIKGIASKNELFKASEEIKNEIKPQDIQPSKFAFKEKLKLVFKLNKRKWLSIVFVSFIVCLISVLLGLSQSFVSFSSDEVLNDMLTNQNQNAMAFKKGVFVDETKQDVDLSTLILIDEKDEQILNDIGYDQKDAYKLYNYSLPVSLRSWQLPSESSIDDKINLREMYLQEIYGVLICDDNFMAKVFGNDHIIAGDINDKNYGITITDYIADSILYYRSDLFKNYDDNLKTYRNNSDSVYAYINAIIDTNYKQKHKTVIDSYKKDMNVDELKTFLMSDEYLVFYEDVKSFLGVAYTTNPNFLKDSNVKEARNIVRFDNSIISFAGIDDKIILNSSWGYANNVVSGYSAPDNTILFSLSEINKILNQSYTIEQASFLNGMSINIERYHRYKTSDEPLTTIKAKIQVVETGSFPCMIGDAIFKQLREYDVMPYMYYFSNLENMMELYDALKDNAFVPYSSLMDAANEINKVVFVFQDFFALILTLLIIIQISVLTTYSVIVVKSSSYNIGILKALGMKDKDVIYLYLFHIILLGLVTTIMFIPALYGFAYITNGILFNSFMTYLQNPALKYIQILSLNPWIFISNILIIFAVITLTLITPIMLMKKIKPLAIIKKNK